jgi:hypothetical protein
MGLNITGESAPVQWGVLPTVPLDSTLDAARDTDLVACSRKRIKTAENTEIAKKHF